MKLILIKFVKPLQGNYYLIFKVGTSNIKINQLFHFTYIKFLRQNHFLKTQNQQKNF